MTQEKNQQLKSKYLEHISKLPEYTETQLIEIIKNALPPLQKGIVLDCSTGVMETADKRELHYASLEFCDNVELEQLGESMKHKLTRLRLKIAKYDPKEENMLKALVGKTIDFKKTDYSLEFKKTPSGVRGLVFRTELANIQLAQ